MNIAENVPLERYSTMRLGGPARFMTTADSARTLLEALDWASARSLKVFVLGGGSNIIFTDAGYDGLVVANRITGFEIVDDAADSTTIRIGGGEIWDDVVARTVALGLSGVEALSAIPGTAGATPVQNVGAYGQEIADTFVELEAVDRSEHAIVRLEAAQCDFRYRDSVFKSTERGRYVITSITLQLSKTPMSPPFYASLQKRLDSDGVHDYSPSRIRRAVIAVRKDRLPDPVLVPNTGSFFKNPIVPTAQYEALREQHPDVPGFAVDDETTKVPAGWLIEHAGLKGVERYGMKTFGHNALVIVNDAAGSSDDLMAFRDHIVDVVNERFGVTLEQEPEIIR